MITNQKYPQNEFEEDLMIRYRVAINNRTGNSNPNPKRINPPYFEPESESAIWKAIDCEFVLYTYLKFPRKRK